MYFTDRGLEELEERRGEDRVTLGWLADRLREFVDLHPDAESSIDALASWLARHDDDPDELDGLDGPPGLNGQLSKSDYPNAQDDKE
jgi:hypothetical protein